MITSQPVSQSVVQGSAATFTVTATGGAPLAYQWKKNGTDIPGATSSTLTVPDTLLADSGTVYSVVVSTSADKETSSNAILTVTAQAVKPAITTQPAERTVGLGSSASFSVSATGTAPLLYQWKKGGTAIPNATSSSYTTPFTSLADNGAEYSVEVSNDAGKVTSKMVVLAVTAAPVAPTIASQPVPQSVVIGETASFSVNATGTAPLTYQWKRNGSDIAAATSSTYRIAATVSGDNAAVFTVVVSNSQGQVTSTPVTLTVAAVAPSFTTQVAAQTITAGQTATFSVTATGTAPLIYQWKKGGTVIPGATTSSYTTPVMSYAGNGKEYSVEVSNSADTVTSSATLTVNKTPSTSYGLVASASDVLYDKTECVQDNSTGLIWEGKNAIGSSSRLGSALYTNYDGTGANQKGPGAHASSGEITDSTNSIGYRNSVNTSGLCGFTDWQMPTKEELLGIVLSGSIPTIDDSWFPNTENAAYWSASEDSGDSAKAWYVGFLYGAAYYYERSNSTNVRLVRRTP